MRKLILLLLMLALATYMAYADIDVTGKFVPKNAGFTGLVDDDQVLDSATTSANILVSDATSFQSVAMSGDATIDAAGAVTVSGGSNHDHDGDTLQCDGISSDGGNFDFASTGAIHLEPGADLDDFIQITTVANQTTINFSGQDGKITAGNGAISFDNENLSTTGTLAAGVTTVTGLINTSVGLDAVGAVDMDYGSVDVPDHTFTTDDCTVIIDGGVTISTGDALVVGTTTWTSSDEFDGTKIKDADYGDVTIDAGGDWDVENSQTVTTNANLTGDVTSTGNATDITESVLAVGGSDTVFPADPNADKFLKWDDVPGELVWDDAGGAEVNNLETICTDIADTEIFIGTGANAGNYAAMSGEATMSNAGAVTLADTVTVTGWTMGASVATTPAGDDADTSLATTAFCETTQDYLKTGELAGAETDPNVDTADEIEAILTNDNMDFGTGTLASGALTVTGAADIFTGTTLNDMNIIAQETAGNSQKIEFKEGGNSYFALFHDGTGSSPNNLLKIQAADGADGVLDVDAITIYQSGNVAISGALTEAGNAVYNSTETPGGSLGGTWASPTIDDLFIKLGGDVASAGTYDFGSASVVLEVPNAAAPTTDATGEMAIDTDLITQGMLQVYLASAIANVVATTDTPGDNEIPTYDAGGGTVQWEAAAGGGTPAGADTQLQYNDGGAFGGLADLTWDDTNLLVGASSGTTQLQFRDNGMYVASLGVGHLDLAASTAIDLNSSVILMSQGTEWLNFNDDDAADVEIEFGTDSTVRFVLGVDDTDDDLKISRGADLETTPSVVINDTTGVATITDAVVSTSLALPNGAAPTTDATAEIALDTTITDHQPLLQYYDGGENMSVIAIDTAQLPALDNEVIAYDAGTDKFVLEAPGAGSSEWTDEGAYVRPADGNEYVAASDTGTRTLADGDGDMYVENDLEVDGILLLQAVADPTTGVEGAIAWDSDDDAIEVYDGSAAKLIPSSMCLVRDQIWGPEYIQDDNAIFHCNAHLYPHGVTITLVSITLPADAAYTLVFEEWAGDPAVWQSDIESVTTGATDAFMQSTSIDDSALDAGDYIFLDIPPTSGDWIYYEVYGYANPGN